MTAGIYIHVPFCLRKCGYCDFFSMPFDGITAEKYTCAIIRNLRRYDGVTADTVYFGGGTPSLLSPEQIYRILSSVSISRGAEISMECNPATADDNKLRGFHDSGVNRISIGIQSLSDTELKASGRLHSAEQAVQTVLSANSAGFENISADIIAGLPFQNYITLENTLVKLAELPIKHISAYMLTIAENTPLANDKDLLGKIADEETLADMYILICDFLKNRGMVHYEISNFAEHSFECKHNLKYWKCEPYIGIGPAAHSCFGGKRFSVPKDIESFIANEYQTENIIDDSPCGDQERIMLALRLKEGIPASTKLLSRSAPLEKAGYIKVCGGRISLTDKGFLVSNEIICRLTDEL